MSVAVASFLAFGVSQVGSPGPANMALLATGARFGLRRAAPFVAGVVLGKQLIIWPIGFGLMELADRVPMLFAALKWVCVAYIVWLAWRIANMSLSSVGEDVKTPGFMAGLAVHPLNPKAWAMITTGFTSFVSPGTPVLHATAVIAVCLAACQLVLHPLWTIGGQTIARSIAGRPVRAQFRIPCPPARPRSLLPRRKRQIGWRISGLWTARWVATPRWWGWSA